MPSKRLLFLLGAFCLHQPELSATSITGGGVTVESKPTPEPGLQAPQSIKPIEPYKPAELPKISDGQDDLKSQLPAIPDVSPGEAPLPLPSATPKLDEFGQALVSAADDFRARRFEAALTKINKAESLQPGNSDVLNFRGAILAETQQYDEAKLLYERALRLEPLSFWPKFNLAEIEFMQKKYADARKGFELALKDFPDNELLRFKIVLTYLMEKNESAARAELGRFKFPSDTAAYYFAFAAQEFASGNKKGGDEWIASGVRVFGRDQTDFLYQTLADLGWLPLPRP